MAVAKKLREKANARKVPCLDVSHDLATNHLSVGPSNFSYH